MEVVPPPNAGGDNPLPITPEVFAIVEISKSHLVLYWSRTCSLLSYTKVTLKEGNVTEEVQQK